MEKHKLERVQLQGSALNQKPPLLTSDTIQHKGNDNTSYWDNPIILGLLAYASFKSWCCHKEKAGRNFVGRMREEKRGSGLGLLNGKQDQEEKVAEGLTEKHLETTSLEEIWCSSFLCS